MELPEVAAYTPIVGVTMARDGRRVAVIVPRYDAALHHRTLRLLVLDLDSRARWFEPHPGPWSLMAPSFAADGRVLAMRQGPGGTELVILDPDHPDAPARVLPGAPPWATAPKWCGALPAVLGTDEEGCRRVWRWSDPSGAPEAVTPAEKAVADYAFSSDGRLAWLHHLDPFHRREAPVSTLFLDEGATTLPVRAASHLAWGPDGRLAMLGRPGPVRLASPVLALVEDGATRTVRVDGWIGGFDWHPEGELLVATARGVEGLIVRVGPEGERPLLPPGPHRTEVRADRAGGRVVFVEQAANRPPHLRLLQPGRRSVRLSRFNRNLPEANLRPAETFAWEGPAGPLSGVLVRPHDRPAPLVLWAHGGPAEAVGHTFSTTFQHLAAQGFAVLAPNYRGSTAHGDDFLRASRGRLCDVDLEDLRSAIGPLVTAGVADPERIAAVGWSYGGTLALALAARDPRVRAVVAGAPVVDWVGVFGTPIWPALTREYFGKAFWEDRRPFDRASPVTWAARIGAPVLLLHGEGDDRVQASQSVLLHRALQALGKTSDLRLFPGEGHALVAPWAVREMLVRTVGWLREHLGVEA